MSQRNIKLTIAYDGTDFSGWQVQNNERTVQGVLQNAVEKIHGCPISIVGAGRTDSGVHATGQVANFSSGIDSIPAEKFLYAINAILPDDARIISSSAVQKEFHSRKSASRRIYRYYLSDSVIRFPHQDRYCHHVRKKMDLSRLNRIASSLIGKHDFTTFSSAGDLVPNRTRKIFSSCFYPEGPLVVYKIAANAFLRKMVRSVVGTIIELAENGGSEERMSQILRSRDRSNAGTTAPAKGLFLCKVIYEDEAACPF